MTAPPLTAALLLTALLAAGCAGPGPEDYAGGGAGRAGAAADEPRPVGANAVGEACLAQRGAGAVTLPGPALRGEEVFCGGWTQPAARIAVVPAAAAPPAEAVSGGPWRAWLDQRFQCAAPQETTVQGGFRAHLLACQRRSTGAAHLALAIAGPDGTVLADGLPAALPVIERLVAGAAAAGVPAGGGAAGGVPAGGPVARSEALRIAVAQLGAEREGAAAEEQFERLMSHGRELNQAENFAAAEDAYQRALELRRRVLGPGRQNDPSVATPMMHVALNRSNQGRFRDADQLFAAAAPLAAASADPTAAARLELYRGLHEANRGDPAAAERHLAAAEAGFRALAPRGAPASRAAPAAAGGLTLGGMGIADPVSLSAAIGLAETLRHRAAMASRAGDPAVAAARLEASRTALRDAGLAPTLIEGRTLRTEGVAMQRGGQPGRAAGVLNSAQLRFAAAVPNERPVGTTRLLTGAALAQAGREDEAVAAFRAGADVLERRRSSVTVAEVMPFLDAIDGAMTRRGDAAAALGDEAFRAAQLIRRNATARTIALSSARLAAAEGNERVARALREQEEASRRLRAAREALDEAARAGRPTAALDAEFAAAQAAQRAAEEDAQTGSRNPELLADDPVTAEETRRALGPRDALVQFVLGATHSYAIAVRAEGPARLARLDIGRARAAELVAAARAGVEQGAAGGAPPRFDTAAAAELHARLLAPLGDALRQDDTLIVVPDGPLLALPFGMLLTGPADAGSLRDAPWLIHRHAVAHAPSVQALVRLRAGAAAAAPRAPRPFVGFGDFAPPSAEQLRASFPAERCGDDARALRGFGRLPGTRREVEAAAGLFGAGATRVLGAAFTGAAVRDGGLAQYRVVHFATHGLLPTDLACVNEPSLLVSPPAGARDAAAALFTASAVTRLELNADLAVLSACNTAGPGGVAGAEQASEALSGLARAFFVAGARGLLATQWLANDAVAPLLIASTLSAQEAGLPTAEALRQVQLRIVRGSGRGGADLSHPVFWAPFVLLGDGVTAAASPGAARVADASAAR